MPEVQRTDQMADPAHSLVALAEDRLMVLDICAQFAAAVTMSDVLTTLVTGAATMVGAEAVWYAVLRDGELRIAEHYGLRNPEFVKQWVLLAGEGVGGRALTDRAAVIANDYLHDPRRVPAIKAMADREHIRSVATAPVMSSGDVRGVLYCATRRPHSFDDDDGELLVSLGRLAARVMDAFEHRDRLVASIRHLQDTSRTASVALEQSLALSDVMLTGATVGELVERLSGYIGRAVVFRDLEEEQAPAPWGTPMFEVPVIVPDRTLGHLYVYSDTAICSADQMLVRHCATLVAADAVRRRARLEAELSFNARFLDDLFSGSRSDDESLNRDAVALGIDLMTPRWIVVAAPAGDEAEETFLEETRDRALDYLRERSPSALVVTYGSSLVMLLEASNETSALRDVPAVQELLNPFRRGCRRAGVGVGRRCASARDYAAGYREALFAARVSATRPSGPVVAADELGIFSAFAHVVEDDALETAVEDTFAPLRGERNADKVADYLATVEAFLENNLNLESTAAQLHIHVNTLRYRLNKIQALLRIDLKDATQRFQLELALRLRRHLR